MRNLRLCILTSLTSVTVLVLPLGAITVNYAYVGTPFTSVTAGFPFPNPPVEPTIFTISDYVFGTVSLDIPLGTPSSIDVSCNSEVPCSTPMMLGATTHGGTGTIVLDSLKPPTSPYTTHMGTFVVNASGEIMSWSFDAHFFPFIHIFSGSTGDFASVETGSLIETASSKTPGTWSMVSVPESSSLILLSLGLVGLVARARKKRHHPVGRKTSTLHEA